MAKKIIAVHVGHPGNHPEYIEEMKLSDYSRESRETVYNNIKGGGAYYYTTGGGYTGYVETAISASGKKYIRTKADGTTKDNLLDLDQY